MTVWPPRLRSAARASARDIRRPETAGRRASGGRRAFASLVAAALTVAVTGCAYFNTFYNAQASFKKAERARGVGGEEAPVSSAAIRQYDATIEKCNKVIQHHSGSRWVDDAILLMGRAYFGKAQYGQALNKFRALADGFPDSNLRSDALFWTALSYYRLARDDEGKRTVDQLLREYPKFRRRDELLRAEAASRERVGDVAGALGIYRRIVREFPDGKQRTETLFGIGALYMREGAFDSAYAAYDEVMRSAHSMEVRLEARTRRGEALLREERYAEALDTYRSVLDLAGTLEPDERAVIELRIGESLRGLGEYTAAIVQYEKIMEDYPGTVHAAEAMFQVGFIHELYLEDYATARERYDGISALQGAGARSFYADQGAARSQNLARLVELGLDQNAGGAGVDAEAEAALLLAEQFLFQQEDTTRAISQYRLTETRFPDTAYGARACYAQALLRSHAAAEPDSAVAAFVRVLDRYPGSPQALGAGDFLTARSLEHLIPEGALDVKEEPADTTATPGPSDAAATSADVGDAQPVPAPADSSAIDPRGRHLRRSRPPDPEDAFERERGAAPLEAVPGRPASTVTPAEGDTSAAPVDSARATVAGAPGSAPSDEGD